MKTTPNTSSRAVTPRILGFSALGAYFAVLLVGILLNGGKASPLDTSFVIYLHPLIYAVAWLVLGGILVVYGSISKVFVYRFTWLAAMGYAVATAACGGSSALTVSVEWVTWPTTVLRPTRMHPSVSRAVLPMWISTPSKAGTLSSRGR